MNQSFSQQVKLASQGYWPLILTRMGINPKLLDGRNHPCPACGGVDRFQFTSRGNGADYGRFACRGMNKQGGDGFSLVMHVFDLSFPKAIMAVAKVLGININGPRLAMPVIPVQPPPPVIDNTTKLQAILDNCQQIRTGNTAGKYLINRGLSADYWPASGVLRFASALDYWHSNDEDKPIKLGVWPALVAHIQKPDGSLAGIHRIYLSQAGHKADIAAINGEVPPSKKLQSAHTGAIRGAACRLFPIGEDGRLALTEGIETAIAVHRMTGLAVWACISAGGLRNVVLPDNVREVLIYGDNDLPDEKNRNAGKESAYFLAARQLAMGKAVKVLLPPLAGIDWLDVLSNELNRAIS
ncbi:zinc-binding protein [Iodobacter sp. HSC-16F04]|uniref:Zinc-binding protein n=1 Tax=Iodobacter violaceini TaxID=3044271 RepID=A0ABX0KUR3_9NEIS|nr:toprim domain-containing protein [Iodobacter violacea]NHQ88445.1 zinc-binding protein [Iodobacter violacea]